MFPPQGGAEVEALTTDVMALQADAKLPASVFYVKTDGDDTNDGTTWAKALLTIDAAVGKCTSGKGDVIFVAPGTYDETANGTSGVICDKTYIQIIGTNHAVRVKNTDTADSGSVFTVLSSGVLLKDLNLEKGETTSDNAVVIQIGDASHNAFGTRLYGTTIDVEKASFTGVKIRSGSTGTRIGKGDVRLGNIRSSTSVGTGLDIDAALANVSGISLLNLTMGIEFGANSRDACLCRTVVISDCTTGIHLTSGAIDNILMNVIAACTTAFDDDSGNATNDFHSSVTHQHDEMRHIPKRSGVTYYVDGTNGKDTNCGCNPDEAFKTIAVALAAAGTGDTVVVMAIAATYNEAGLTMSTKGVELMFEWGAVLEDQAGGDVITVANAATNCRLTNVYVDNNNSGGDCFVISGDSCCLSGCIAIKGVIGFDVRSDSVFLKSCVATDNSTTQFDLISKYGRFYNCVANGDGQAVRGFYLSNATADLNTFFMCASLGNTTAGWEIVSNANENLFLRCSMGANDGAKADNGTNNTWAGWFVGSQISAGQSREEDSKDIYDLVEAKSVGKLQIATTTEDLDQAAGSYDLLTGTTQSVILEKLVIRMPTEAAGGAITSISIQTDDVTPSVIINSSDGAVGNLTSEAQLAWTGAILIAVGTKIQVTIAGGAHGSTYTTTIVAQCRSVVAGGYLVG